MPPAGEVHTVVGRDTLVELGRRVTEWFDRRLRAGCQGTGGPQ